MDKDKIKKIIIGVLFVIVAMFFVIVVPLLINEAYKFGGYVTLWDAKDLLSYYGTVLGASATIIAVILTILYSQKSIKRQINFQMAQISRPVFNIQNIYSGENNSSYKRANNSDTCYNEFKYDGHFWSRSFLFENNNVILDTREEKSKIVNIIMTNCGEGIALNVSYKIDEFSQTLPETSLAVSKNNQYIIKYNLSENIQDRFVYPTFINALRKKRIVMLHTYIHLTYKNTLGVPYNQDISIQIITDKSVENQFVLRIEEISEQQIQGGTTNARITS